MYVAITPRDFQRGARLRNAGQKHKGRRSVVRNTVARIALIACGVLMGCSDSQTIWSTQAKSPDGFWVASAQTERHSGPGNAAVLTTVYLRRTSDSGKPDEILVLAHDPHSQSGTVDLMLQWLTPTHLEIGYGQNATVDFEVVKYAGIDITVRSASIEPIGASGTSK